jgi:hypothetical protein
LKDSVIVAKLPTTAVSGTRYRVRVSSTRPAQSGLDRGSYFTIYPKPDVSIMARKPVDFCEGNNVPLVATGGASYRWSTGDTTASVDIGQAGWHYVTATNEFGCETTDSIKLTSHPYPTASVTASGPTIFCQGGQVVLTGKGGKSYAWSTGAKTSAITVKASGEYYVVVKGDGDCEVSSEKINVIVHPTPPKPTITQQDDVLTSSSTDGNEWYLAGGSKLDSARSFKPTKSGKYYVRVTDSNGCTSQSEFVDVIVEQNGVEFESATLFEVSPNPASDLLEIKLNSGHALELEIVSILGSTIYRKSVLPGDPRSIQLDIKSWAAGSYYLRVTADGRTLTRKIVKQ